MITIFFRTIIIFITIFIIIRLMGKRQIGEMQPLELVVTLVIADLACIPMQDVSIPLLYGITAMISVYFVNVILNLFSTKLVTFRYFMTGKPTIIIDSRGVDEVNLKKLNMTVNDLMESIRGAGYFHLDDIEYAIFETNGQLSVIESANKTSSTSLPIMLIGDGQYMKKTIDNHEAWQVIENVLKQKKLKINQIVIMTLDNKGKIYLKTRGEKFEIIKVDNEKFNYSF